MKTLKLLYILVIMLSMNLAYAGNPGQVKQFIKYKDWNFVENKGQVSSSEIKYYGHQGGVYLNCKPGMIEFVFTKFDKESNQISEATSQPGSDVGIQDFEPLHRKQPFDSQPSPLPALRSSVSSSRADLILLNCNPSAQILASDQQEYYENYYTTRNADSGITDVHTYKTITYKDIYPHIDLLLHCREEGMKYEFVVHPGGKVTDIQMQWNGLEGIKKLENSGIEYSFSLGKMEEGKPVSFQGENIIESDFNKNDNRIGFKVDKYDKTKTLLIDPILIWGTYFGGSGEDEGFGVITDSSGNVYFIGNTESSSNIATAGAFQTSLSTGTNIFLAKFSNKGVLQWATYYGGQGGGSDFGCNIASDGSGNLYVSATTGSNSGIATKGAFQTSNAGNLDVFLAAFNTSGQLKWATYYGGPGQENSGGITTDVSGNIYMTGFTGSSTGIATKGAYQTSYLGGGNAGNGNGENADAFLVKFDSKGAILWGTYFGGSNFDFGYSVVADSYGYVYITGNTSSTSGIATTGAYQASLSGVYDAFLAQFNNINGKIVWSTYFGSNTIGTALATNDHGDLYFTGYTETSTHVGAKNDAYLAKFNTSGGYQWETRYGGSGEDDGWGIATDASGNIYITGNTESSSGIATKGAYQSSYGGNSDAFLAEFDNIGNILWGTYYGGSNTEIGTSVAIDGFDNIYMAGGTGSTSNIATSGAYQTSYAGSEDAFLAKFGSAANDAGIDSILYPIGVACPDPEPVTVQLKNFGAAELYYVDIGWSVNRIKQSVYHWTGKLLPDSSVNVTIGHFLFFTGKDTIKSWTAKPNGVEDLVPTNDTSKVLIHVNPPPVAHIGPNQTICQNSKVMIGDSAISMDSYLWTSNPPGFNSTISNPSVSPQITTVYYLTETVNLTGCYKTDSVIVTVNPSPPIYIGTNHSICIGDSVQIGNDTASRAYTYKWTSNPAGFTSTIPDPFVHPAITTYFILSVTNPKTNCQINTARQIIVNPLPVPNVGQSSYTICIGTRIKIGANAKPDLVYSWSSNPSGFTSTRANPVVNPANNTVYSLSVTDTATGCTNDNSAQIFVGIAHAPVVDVGKNQTVCVGVSAQIGSNSLSGDTYSWTSNPVGYISTTANPVVTPNQTTSYSLTVTSSVGCTNFDSVTITVNARPKPFAGTPEKICSETIVQLGQAPVKGHSYSWSSNPVGFSSTLSNPIDSPKTMTVYTLKETNDSTGCSDSDSVSITVTPRPNVQFDSKNINGFEYQFTTKNPNYPAWQYQWNFGDSLSGKTDTASGYIVSHAYTKNGKYNVYLTVSLPGFCTETDSYSVVINEQFSLNIYPNPFGLQTDINYTLVKPGHVRTSLVDEIGRQLGILLDEQLNRGEYNTYFDASLWKTRPAMYFVLFQLDNKLIVKKMIQLDSIYH